MLTESAKPVLRVRYIATPPSPWEMWLALAPLPAAVKPSSCRSLLGNGQANTAYLGGGRAVSATVSGTQLPEELGPAAPPLNDWFSCDGKDCHVEVGAVAEALAAVAEALTSVVGTKLLHFDTDAGAVSVAGMDNSCDLAASVVGFAHEEEPEDSEGNANDGPESCGRRRWCLEERSLSSLCTYFTRSGALFETWAKLGIGTWTELSQPWRLNAL